MNSIQPVLVFDVTFPGTWLDIEDPQLCSEIRKLLFALETHFFEATMALNLFIRQPIQKEYYSFFDRYEQYGMRLEELEKNLMRQHGETQLTTAIREQAAESLRQEKFADGIFPRQFLLIQSMIHAKAFIYALDGFEKSLGVLSKIAGSPECLAEIHSEIKRAFPYLKGIRNSSHHMEDRVRGLGRGSNGKEGKPINLSSALELEIETRGQVVFLDALRGSTFQTMMENGGIGSIDVSADSMEQLQSIFSQVLGAFRWKGSPDIKPSDFGC